MIKIPRSIYEALIAHARQDAPIEACGYLAGRRLESGGEVVAHFPMKNVDASAEHFAFDPAEQFAVFNQANKQGLKLIACYHSHPATPARPSEEDIRLAYDPNIHYLIVSLAESEPVVKSFRIIKGEVTPETLEVSAE
ncbi:MAG: M67 family metallopeptidase [Zoogloeaceae bacterium]|jgi:proteasome lid subunit RPN8/RPN11|nr:M67 family metallopeptidase [Zoogloeaceae bacterium]